MKTKLETFITEHREELDTAIPDDNQIWHGIALQLDSRKKNQGFLWKAAAIFLILLTVGSVTIYSVNRSLKHQPETISLEDISHELAMEESGYQQQVENKMDAIKASDLDTTLSTVLALELKQIDEQYAACLSDLQDLGDNPRVIRGLIRCYEQKIRILEKTLKENEKRQRHETNENTP